MYRSLADPLEVVQMRKRLTGVAPDDRALWGVMSAPEMMAHVRGAFRMALGRLPVTAPSMRLTGRTLKVLALWMPVRWPQGAPTVKELQRGSAVLDGTDFEQLKRDLVELFGVFVQSRVSTRHVMFGAMLPADWLRWGFLHTDHHLRQFGR